MAGEAKCSGRIKQQLAVHHAEALTNEMGDHSTLKNSVECVHAKHFQVTMSFKPSNVKAIDEGSVWPPYS